MVWKRLPYATLLELNWKAEVGRYWWCRLTDWRPFWGKATEMRAQLMSEIRNYWINKFYSVELPNIKKLDIIIDKSLNRFPYIFAAAGHPNCVFKITYNELIKITNGSEKELSE